MFDIPDTYLDIVQGSTFKHPVACNLPDGTPVRFSSDGNWAARAQVRESYGGVLVATFASDGSGDGTIAFDDQGHITLELTASAASLLAPTFSANGRLLTTHIGDLEAWQTVTATDRRRVTNLKVRIYPEATTT